jgi:hypothetical protein
MEVVAMNTTPEPAWSASAEDVVSTEGLVRRAGAKPFISLSDLPGSDPFGDDAEYDAFLADLYASRRADVA